MSWQEKKEGGLNSSRKKEGGGGAELRLDWDRSYLVPMKYCLSFKEETSTLPLRC